MQDNQIKETILAKIRSTMHFSEETYLWFRKISNINKDIWFLREEGSLFFPEYRGIWNEIMVSSIEPIINDYFLDLGLPKDKLPKVKIYESYHGSWIIDAALIMSGGIGATYLILKGISELPKIADGLMELKERLKIAFSGKASNTAASFLNNQSKQFNLPAPPKNPIITDFIIDARPLTSLSPSIMKSHKIHLNVAISKESLTIENLGEDVMRDIQIGIFKSYSQKNQWQYADSYKGTISIISSKQTIMKEISDFRDSQGQELNLIDNSPLYIDTWVQDSHGIYLFMFLLEK